jgi:hypothetical protein
MQLLEKSISYKYPSIDVASIVLEWQCYIDEGDFPDYPDIRGNWLTVTVKQHQFLKGERKGQYRTIFSPPKGKPWDHSTKEDKKKLVIQEIEKFILSEGNDVLGKFNDPIIAQYKVGENNQDLRSPGIPT